MKNKGAIILGLTALMFSSCIDHEVIPAPIPTVDLSSNFIGEINGAEIVLTENVLGFSNVSTKDQIILAAPDFSSAVYYSAMISSSITTSIKVGLGSISRILQSPLLMILCLQILTLLTRIMEHQDLK